MLGQVEKVLQIGQLDKKDFQLKISQVDLNALVESAVDNSSLTVNKRNGQIGIQLDEQIDFIEGDENHISNVIHNLLDNANKYSPEQPDIHVETIKHKNFAEIKVNFPLKNTMAHHKKKVDYTEVSVLRFEKRN